MSDVAQREKRSISLPPDLAEAIDREAAAAGTTFSAWLAAAARKQLKLEAGRQFMREWEATYGLLTDEELEEGRVRAERLLGRPIPKGAKWREG